VALEGEEVAQAPRLQRGEQARAVDAVAAHHRRPGRDEGHHLAVPSRVDDAVELEHAHARSGAGVVGHEPHDASSRAARRTAAAIAT
jgi:hypothetical protein